MSYWISSILLYCFIGLLTADTGFPARLWLPDGKNSLKETNNIKFDFEPSSSGLGPTDTDDEDLISSGSGLSGSGEGPTFDTDWKETVTNATSTTSSVTTTSRPRSQCERTQHENKMLRGDNEIHCLDNGDYAALQCNGQPTKSHCKCVDFNGKPIPGTLMEAPNFPDCDKGENLHPCVFQVVKSIRTRLLGTHHPKCTQEGQFESVQCHENTCYCVDVDTGKKIDGTETSLQLRPDCEAQSGVSKTTTEPDLYTDKYIKETENIPPKDEDEDDDDIDESEKEDIINIDHTEDSGEKKPEVDADSTEKKTDIEIGKGSAEKEDDDHEDNRADVSVEKIDKKPESESRVEKATSEIMTQPGILAGIIGGSVVVLLCLVLLIMFVVYRMRKKDEGSYPLDEPRKTPNYSYVRAPEKEFYA